MTVVRRDVWQLGSAADPWHPLLLAYAHAVARMQRRWRARGPGSAGLTLLALAERVADGHRPRLVAAVHGLLAVCVLGAPVLGVSVLGMSAAG